MLWKESRQPSICNINKFPIYWIQECHCLRLETSLAPKPCDLCSLERNTTWHTTLRLFLACINPPNAFTLHNACVSLRDSYASAFLTLEAFSCSLGRREGRWIAISRPPSLSKADLGLGRYTLKALLCYRLIVGVMASCETDVRGDVENFLPRNFDDMYFFSGSWAGHISSPNLTMHIWIIKASSFSFLEEERALGSKVTASIPTPAALALKYTSLSLIDSQAFSDTACRFSGAECTTIVYLSRKEHSSVRADHSSRHLYPGAKHDHGTDLFNRRMRATAQSPALLSLHPGIFWCVAAILNREGLCLRESFCLPSVIYNSKWLLHQSIPSKRHNHANFLLYFNM